MSEFQPRNFDLNLLRVFDALWSTRSVTLAAERLCITPSAVSHALNKLRHILGDELYRRGPGGMQPTPLATDIGPKVHNALSQLHLSLSPSEFRPEETQRHFRVSATPYTSWSLLPRLLPRFRQAAPNASIHVIRPGMPVFEALDSGSIDLAIGLFDAMPARFEFLDLFNDRLVWVMGNEASRDLPDCLSLDFIAALQHIHVAIGGEGSKAEDGKSTGPSARPYTLNDRGHLDTALTELGLHRRIEISVPDILTAFAIIGAGDCGMLSPLRLATAASALYPLRLFDLPYDSPPLLFKVAWKRDRELDSAVCWLRDMIVAAAGT